jgi:hypothetical protein
MTLQTDGCALNGWTCIILGESLTHGGSDAVDGVLAAVIAERQRVAQGAWFN